MWSITTLYRIFQYCEKIPDIWGHLWTQCAIFASQSSPPQDTASGIYNSTKCHQGHPWYIQESHPILWPHANQWNWFSKNIPQHIMFVTGSMIKNRKVKKIEDGMKQVNKIYLQRGFKTTCIHADSKFETLHSEISDLGISLNCASDKEHVPDIEQSNRTIKKQVWYSLSAMPFKVISKSMIVHLVATAIFWLNDFPS